jgi:hypothetical protein
MFANSMDDLFQRLLAETYPQASARPGGRLQQRYSDLPHLFTPRPVPEASYRRFEHAIDQLVSAVFGEPYDVGLQDEPRSTPAPTESVHILPVVPAPKSDSCSICLESYVRGTQVKRLPCGHHYHPACIDQWLERDHRCAICRHNIADKKSEPTETSTTAPPDPTEAITTDSPIEVLATWDFNVNILGASDLEMVQLVERCAITPGHELRQSLENYRSAWLEQQTVPQLLTLARQRYLGDRIIPGMERRELTDLLVSTQGGTHLYRRSIRELVTLCRQQPLISSRDLGRCVERSDLVNLLLSIN